MNPSTALATVMVDELVGQGVRHVVLCPGSRSAPFAYAVQAAERDGRLTLHVRVDERSAGFLALGLAKLTRVPAVVVTTSGTAVANLHPAVLEAHHGVVPLVVLSADRPVELRGTGANQTTTQPGMFAAAVRWGADVPAPRVGTPSEAAADAELWRDAARSAVAASTGAGGEAGPVHLNVQLREPLVPTAEPQWAGEAARPPGGPRRVAVEGGRTGAGRAQGADEGARGHAANPPAVGSQPERTLVVVGDLPDARDFDRALAWGRSHGWPVLAEPFGSWPREGVVPHGPLLLTVPGWLDANAPDRVVTVGRVTLSRPVGALLRRPGTVVEAVRTHRWIDSVPSVVATYDPAVLDQPGTGGAPAGLEWPATWEGAGRRLAKAVADAPATWPSGRAVAEVLLEELPPGATLFVGSSNSVRDLDLAATRRPARLTVTASRGLAGIDGCVATATGLALAGARPAYALMGDLSFVHDANGLTIGPDEPRPDLTLVVVNDDGGGIFTLLEPGEPARAADFERVFGTPTGTDLGALCAAHRVPHQRVGSLEELRQAVCVPPEGLRVVEVRVDRLQHRAERARLHEVAAAAFRE